MIRLFKRVQNFFFQDRILLEGFPVKTKNLGLAKFASILLSNKFWVTLSKIKLV